MSDPNKRFEKIQTHILGAKIRNRDKTVGYFDPEKSSPGDFLSRLWTLFGEPSAIEDDGFTYYIQDKETGFKFTAYSGASGPAYGGYPKDADSLLEVIEVFDDLIDKTPRTDCEIKIEVETGYFKIGVADGQAFETFDISS